MYTNPHAGINLPPLSCGLRQTRFRATPRTTFRVSATSLAAVHAARCAADQAMAAAALPAYTEIDYATFRARVDHRDASAPVRQLITRGNSVLIAGRNRQVLAKLEMPWIDRWGVTHGARYFAPTRSCSLPLRAWPARAISLLIVSNPLKLLDRTLIKMQRSCKSLGSRGRAIWRALANNARRMANAVHAIHTSRQASAAHGDPHWTTIRLTA